MSISRAGFSAAFLLLALLGRSAAQNERSPFCGSCKCTNSQDQAVIDVDCTGKFMPINFLYNNMTWFDSSNVSYPYGKLILKDSDTGDVRLQFPYSNLTYLDLTENLIQHIADSSFANLQNMQVLILSHNDIQHLSPHAFKGQRMDGDDYPLRSLTTLKLDNNKLHTLDQDLFEHLQEVLQVLDLSYNHFKVLDLQTTIAIGSIKFLKELNLGFTDIKILPDHFLHTPKYLKTLDLSGNEFDAIPEGLTDSHELEVLYFNNNPIVNLTKENGFPNISSLKVLHLCEMMDLENIQAGSLSRLINLEELHICNNIRLSNIDPGALSMIIEGTETESWPPIRKLYLQENELSSLDFHLVLHWENLKELDLRYNPWTCECENQWFVEELIPMFLKINESLAKELRCEAPVEMKGKTFYEEYSQNKSMRCLDLYGNRPERDGTILVGILIGLLTGIPMVLFLIFAYQRRWFGLFDSSPAAFSRQFYSRTRSEDA